VNEITLVSSIQAYFQLRDSDTEAAMTEDGDDAGHCSSGLSAQNYRGATAEDRSIYRKWMLGTVLFYSMLLLISGVVAVLIDTSPGLTRLTTLSVHSPAGSFRSN
jgi:hypothetical protein